MQPSFFDVEERLARLSALGNQLEAFSRTEAGLDVGERRVGRLMKDNGIRPVRTRRHKVTTDSHHQSGFWTVTSLLKAPTGNGQAISAISGLPKAGSTWLSSSICSVVV